MEQKALDTLRGDLVEATRRSFDICRRETAGQTIYSYALVAASVGGEALQPWCHTEETFAKKEAKLGKGQDRPGYRRYNPDEWWATVGGPVTGGRGRDWWDDLSQSVHSAYVESGADREGFFDLLCDTLKSLDAEGYFGTGEARAAVTLMVYVSDDGASEKWWPESVRRLNPPAVVKQFRNAVN